MIDDFANRLRKRERHLAKWARRWPTDAYRVYDWDIPEWAYAVDRYAEHVHLQEFVHRKLSEGERLDRLEAVVATVSEALEVPEERIHTKERRQQKGGAQYELLDEDARRFWVHEGQWEFLVDLDSRLDTGLFLDHRETRRMVAEEVKDRGKCLVLNLFAYTGAFSVWAAGAGGTVTTVDLSNTYLDWAQRNFRQNGLDVARHRFVRSDILRWLPQAAERGERFDVMVLDPPTFSRSKKMERDLDTQRDHADMIRGAMALGRRGATLWFSTNFRDFELRKDLSEDFVVEEITGRTIPEDFKPGIHRAWRIRSE